MLSLMTIFLKVFVFLIIMSFVLEWYVFHPLKRHFYMLLYIFTVVLIGDSGVGKSNLVYSHYSQGTSSISRLRRPLE